MSGPGAIGSYGSPLLPQDDSWMGPEDYDALSSYNAPLDGGDGIPLRHAGAGSDWIPQGQGYDETRNQVLTSYYKDGGPVLLSFEDLDPWQNCEPAKREFSVELGGTSEDPDNAPGKGGGVATDGTYVYVADGGEVFVYRREDVMAQFAPEPPDGPVLPGSEPLPGVHSGATVQAIARIPIDPPNDGNEFTASYLTVKDGQLYVGDFTSTRLTNYASGRDDPTRDAELRRYAIDPETGLFGGARVSGDDAMTYDSIDAPKYAQGAAVTDTGVVFSTSLGSGFFAPADELVFQQTTSTTDAFSTDGDARVIGRLDHYAEGLNFIDGQLWVTHESAADKYRDNVDDPHDQIQVHSIDDLGISAEDLGVESGDH